MSLGFYFDSSRCIGCKACQVACKDRFDLQIAGAVPRRVLSFEVGTYPDAELIHISMGCNHCANPQCVSNCPTGSMHVSLEDGTVQHDDAACIGCKTCMMSCPYGAPQFSTEFNLVVKCDSCKPLRDAGMSPVCVDSCVMRALDFGDMETLKQKYGSGLVSEISCMPAASITTPSFIMKTDGIPAGAQCKEVLL